MKIGQSRLRFNYENNQTGLYIRVRITRVGKKRFLWQTSSSMKKLNGMRTTEPTKALAFITRAQKMIGDAQVQSVLAPSKELR